MGKRGNSSRAWNKRKRLKNRKMGKSIQPDMRGIITGKPLSMSEFIPARRAGAKQ